ncbi:uncharacterized protein DS421_2g57020 [Arachis hypogaea]|nr:uncharacterized protein DS421_2g57020 [Arachis hypogaea]
MLERFKNQAKDGGARRGHRGRFQRGGRSSWNNSRTLCQIRGGNGHVALTNNINLVGDLPQHHLKFLGILIRVLATMLPLIPIISSLPHKKLMILIIY